MTTIRRPLPRARLLLVSGDAELEAVTRATLTAFSAEAVLIPTDDPDTALAAVRSSEPPDLIVLTSPEDADAASLALLSILKQDEALRVIPVVVVSRRDHDEDAFKHYRAYANAYVPLPDTAAGQQEALRALLDLYFRVAKLSPRE
jgi:CheY-like chemotaxis protein